MITRTSISNRLNDSSKQPKPKFIKAGLAALSIGLAATFMGCGDKEVRLSTHKVAGKVLKNGTGIANATVVFHAHRNDEGFIKPRAITKTDGSFEMTTYDASDGAPVGEYEVSVERLYQCYDFVTWLLVNSLTVKSWDIFLFDQSLDE